MAGKIIPARLVPGAPADQRDTPWDLIDHAYCLTLATRSDRQQEVLRAIGNLGLSGQTSFIVSDPATGPKPPAIFDSHCQAARDAVGRGFRRVLIMEDDVHFLSSPRVVAERVRRAMAELPAAWQGLYLGHFPLRSYFHARGVLRTLSGCSHAYIASPALLDWLARLDPHADLAAGRIKLCRLIGQGIDAALACRPHMYACFPMLATQGRSPSSNIDPVFNRHGQKRGLFDKYRYSAMLIRRMRAAECIAALLSPIHRVTRSNWLSEDEADELQ